MFNSEGKRSDKQHAEQMAASQESSDMSFVAESNKTNSAFLSYDPQVSGMLITVRDRFLPLRFVPKLDKAGNVMMNEDGQPQGEWVADSKFGYMEPYGEEALGFVDEGEEKQLINRIDGALDAIYTYSEKYNVPMTNCFNYFVRMRQGQILNTRTTGRPSKLAKSQIVDTTANINRQMIHQKKKGFLGGLFG